MDHAQEVELVRRVHAHLAAKTTDADPAGTTLETAAYADRTRLEREIERIFRGREAPLAVAHGAMLPHAGDFLTHDLSGVPLLLARRDDGGVDAFVNVCRHRGTRVESAARGNKRAFSCPYHGWTYGKGGRLTTVPHERGFACIDKSARGLRPVPAAEAAGLVFVLPGAAGESTVDAAGWLGPLAADLSGYRLAAGTSAVVCERRTTRAMSWKLAIDIFLETYHLRPTHKDTIYPLFFDNVGLVDKIGPHLRNVFPKRTIRDLSDVPEGEWELRKHANVLYLLFPNTLVLVQPEHSAVLHVWPDGADRCVIDAYMVVPEAPTTSSAQRYWQANADILYGATDEDIAMGESIQRGLGSGANRDVVFGAFEHALAHFHRQVAKFA